MRKKKLVRCLAFWLSVVMLVFSLPTAASEVEETTMVTDEAAVEENTEVNGATSYPIVESVLKSYEWKEDSGLATRSVTDDEWGNEEPPPEYNYETVTGSTIPDGVYNLYNTGSIMYFMDVENGRSDIGAKIQQRMYGSDPVISFTRRGLFKIARYRDTNYYVIRLMTNNYLSFKHSNNSLVTYEINMFDERVELEETFSITETADGYVIRPYGSTLAVSAPSTESSVQDLTLQDPSIAGDKAAWQLSRYTDVNQYGVDHLEPIALNPETQVMFGVKAAWTTKTDVAYTDLSISVNNPNVLSWTWDFIERELWATLSAEGAFQLVTVFESFDEYNVFTKTYDYAVRPVEGTYYLWNSKSLFLADIENQSTESGAKLVQWEFAGQSSAKWNLEYIPEDPIYCRLKSVYSGLYMGVDSNDGGTIRQYSMQSNYTMWRIETSSDSFVKLICKAFEGLEGHQKILALSGTPVNIPNGHPLYNRSENSSNDEGNWLLMRCGIDRPVTSESQDKDRWCWAASARIFASNYVSNITRSQADVVALIKGLNEFGEPKNEGGTRTDAKLAMKHYGVSSESITIKENQIYSEATLIQFLHDGHVVYVSRGQYTDSGVSAELSGHATVVVGYGYVDSKRIFIVQDPADHGFYSNKNIGRTEWMTYDRLRTGEMDCINPSNDSYRWRACIVANTSYSDTTISLNAS